MLAAALFLTGCQAMGGQGLSNFDVFGSPNKFMVGEDVVLPRDRRALDGQSGVASSLRLAVELDQQKRLAKWYLKNGWQLLDVERVYAIASLVDFLDRYRGKEVVPTTIGFYGSKTPQVIKDKFDSYSIGFEEHFSKLAN